MRLCTHYGVIRSCDHFRNHRIAKLSIALRSIGRDMGIVKPRQSLTLRNGESSDHAADEVQTRARAYASAISRKSYGVSVWVVNSLSLPSLVEVSYSDGLVCGFAKPSPLNNNIVSVDDEPLVNLIIQHILQKNALLIRWWLFILECRTFEQTDKINSLSALRNAIVARV